MIETTQKIGELAVKIPGATRLFETLKIDYCCGGGKTLAEACADSRLDADEVMRRLDAIERQAEDAVRTVAFEFESLTELSRHIVERHHTFTREELARIEALSAKVVSKHSANHPELLKLQSLVNDLKVDLLTHMLKEEQVLFPYIERLQQASDTGGALQPAFFGTVRNPVRMMMLEHDAAGDLLAEMRRVTSDYTAPEDACMSFRTLYQALEGLEADLHEHIHLENNLLFPHAIKAEETALQSIGQ